MHYVFGGFSLDTARYELRRSGKVVPLRGKVFDVLAYLVTHHDRVVSRDELLEQVWPDQFIAETTLTSCIKAVRQALGDTGRTQHLIKTVHGRGYRCLVPVARLEPAAPEALSPSIHAFIQEVSEPLLIREEQLAPLRLQPTAERRQLTVLSCELVDAAVMTVALDPEALHGLMQRFLATCTGTMARFGGFVAYRAEHGMVVYFGYPQAHEDDALRAVRAALALVAKAPTISLDGAPLSVRIGIHTGLVIIEVPGQGQRGESLAIGAAPTIASQLRERAEANTVVLSETTAHLVQGYVEWQELASPLRVSSTQVLSVYRVIGESSAQTRLDVGALRGLTPFVGREVECLALQQRWAQVQAGMGQIVVLRGEAGIGKSRLLQVFKAHVAQAPHICLECRSSPYYQNTALYPITELLQRLLGWQHDDEPEAKLEKLEQWLQSLCLPLEASVPLLAGLLSLPIAASRYPPLNLSPQQQRHKTLETLLNIIMGQLAQQPMLLILEDLHWTDPTTLELLELLIEQAPRTSLYLLASCRPAFQSPWSHRSYLSEIVVTRLSPCQVESMAEQVAGGRPLPEDVLQHIVEKTDGVPLFVEEMTKAVLESGYLKDVNGRYELAGPLASLSIPATLQDSLMARLDQMSAAKEVVQLGAVIGRDFPYDLIQAISSQDDEALQAGLTQLVEVELLYQRGRLPQVSYMFKHALVQDAAYQSLLHGRRRQLHQQVAEALETGFPHLAETQPELVAHHFTEAECAEPAMAYWLRAGQSAVAHSAYAEAIEHLTRGLQVLGPLSNTESHRRRELDFQVALGAALRLSKGFSSPQAGHAYARAHVLCEQVGDAPQLALVLNGLWAFYATRASFQSALEAGEQLLALGERQADVVVQHLAHSRISAVHFFYGEHVRAQAYIDQATALYDSRWWEPAYELRYGTIYGTTSHQWSAWNTWVLGYPERAWQWVQTAFELAQASTHRHGRISNLYYMTQLHEFCRQAPAAWKQANQTIAAANELGAAQWAAWATCVRGWALAAQNQPEEGIAQLHQGLEALESLEVEIFKPWYLAKLGEAYGIASRPEEGLQYIDQGLALVETTEQFFGATELYRLRGHLSLLLSPAHDAEAEADFQHALDMARQQQAKSLELRAAVSLARLWQSQGRRLEAHELLAPVYDWFTEGFDMADLKEAKRLLEAGIS